MANMSSIRLGSADSVRAAAQRRSGGSGRDRLVVMASSLTVTSRVLRSPRSTSNQSREIQVVGYSTITSAAKNDSATPARIVYTAHSRPSFEGLGYRLEIRFRGPVCYVDAAEEGVSSDAATSGGEPLPLCRLRFSGDPDRWSFAFYTYSAERYERPSSPRGS
jgi:hypothetical protein